MMNAGFIPSSRSSCRNCRPPAGTGRRDDQPLADCRPRQPQLPKGWTLTDHDDKRELRNASGKLVTEITYLQRKGKREPISIEQHVFKYHITIQYLGD